MARHVRVLLRGGLQLAVMATVLGSNPVRDVSQIKSKAKPKGAQALKADEVRDLLGKPRVSEFCRHHDLVDPITMLIATGLRRPLLLALRWRAWAEKASTTLVTGKVVRVTGKGLIRFDDAKTESGTRTLPLPRFATDMLKTRPNCLTSGSNRSSSRPPRAHCATPTTLAGTGAQSGSPWACPPRRCTSFRKRWPR